MSVFSQSSLFCTINQVLVGVALTATAYAADDGKQMQERFRVNFAGYLPQATKTALYLAEHSGPIGWQLLGTDCTGSEDTYVKNDYSSGDSFYRIDFSHCTAAADKVRLQVDEHRSAEFAISANPYGKLRYEFFDYFRDHQTEAAFTQTINNWQKDLTVHFRYVKDAGDNGVYPVNTAEAAWSLINLLETYPAINTYYQQALPGAVSVYAQLTVLTEQFHHVFAHGGKLAIAKFHANVNDTWALCAPHTKGSCISMPETKATYSTARTLAAMARLHKRYGSAEDAKQAYALARTAWQNAESEPLTCLTASSFGGEGGMYPNNDNYAQFRNPEKPRDPCYPDKNNTEDDQYAALAELYLAAVHLQNKKDAKKFAQAVKKHPRFAEISSFWWGAVAAEGNLSLLTHEQHHALPLQQLKSNVLRKADEIVANQQAGYPGVTWDARSNQWDSGDQDEVDNNVRWGSHRMALNDARILMAAAEVKQKAKQAEAAAHYARAAIQVLDHISGVNPLNLAMFTANGYPFIEHAVIRTHDGADPKDYWPGKMVLGPNNWTNANDPDMPAFGSQPGLKMFAVTGRGWASREISIDANAALIPVSYFTAEVAPTMLAGAPIAKQQK